MIISLFSKVLFDVIRSKIESIPLQRHRVDPSKKI